MSRHGYVDECDMEDELAFGRWRAQVQSAIRGRKGQRLLRDMIDGLEAMPEGRRELHAVVVDDGEHACALGVVARVRGLDLGDLNPEWDDEFEGWDDDDVDPDWLAEKMSSRLDIASQLAREVMYENDEAATTPEGRWRRMYGWALHRYQGPLNPFALQPVAGRCAEAFGQATCEQYYWARRVEVPSCTADAALPEVRRAQ